MSKDYTQIQYWVNSIEPGYFALKNWNKVPTAIILIYS